MANILFAFGFFFLCSCSLISVNQFEQAESELENEEYESALASVNRVLETPPRSDEALYLKSRILFELARNLEQPENRFNYYRDMRNTMDELDTGAPNQLAEERNQLILTAWEMEQGAAVQLMQQNNGNPQSRNFDLIIAHFENAEAINPDSASTYDLQATTYYENGEVTMAIETLHRAGEHISPLPVDVYEKLAFLYLEDGQIDRSIASYQLLYERHPNNRKVVHGLINAYILADQHAESVSLLREQIRIDPSNINYHEALATELFYLAQSKIDELTPEDLASSDIETFLSQIFEDVNEAEDYYSEVRENHPTPDEVTFISASFYKNTAINLIGLAGQADESISNLLYEKANELLRTSIPLWVSIAESNPENPDIWLNIYQVYNQLGMEDEAEDVRSRLNL